MKRMALAVVGGLLLFGATVWAEDTVYVLEPVQKKDTALKGTIVGESPTGIKLRTTGGVKDIPALEITQIDYGNNVVSAIDFRRPDTNLGNALKETRAEKRAELLAAALQGYQELDRKLRDMANIHRYLQFKIALTTAEQAKDDPPRRDAAIAALVEYKTGFPTGWEIVPALQLLARLQEDKGDAAGASQAYADLAAVPGIPAAVKLTNQMLEARLLLRGKKFADAEAKLKRLASSLPKDNPQRPRIDVYFVQAQIARGNLKDAEAKLKGAILANEDADLRALAHNFLGDYYRLNNQPDLAFWEYLKVDTMYNQDKEEHAKALYYLAQLFDRPKNDPVRAEECLAKLKSRQYAGTLYQRLAGTEKKTP
jgi:hypothetical protein